jgi:2-polyprenyl-6-methoxyphenol hydroxylase-like FAD-dependent oxidoreductase
MSSKIAIIGSGTAGLCTALALAQHGHASTVFEKHTGPTVRGAGMLIQPAGIRALEALGVGDAFHEASTPIQQLLGLSHRAKKVVDVRYGDTQARAVSRKALASVLESQAKKSGIDLHYGTRISDIRQEQDSVSLMSDEGSRSFDCVVLADGADSLLRSRAGLDISSTHYRWGALWGLFDVRDWPHPETLMQRYRGTREMFGLMPTTRSGDITTLSFFWSLKLEEAHRWHRADLEIFRDKLFRLWPEASPVIDQLENHSQLAVARYQHAWPKRLGVPRIYVAGDSAHSMSPQLGLGSTLAAQDALEIAQTYLRHGPVDGPLQYSRCRLRSIQTYQWLSRILTPCFQGDWGGVLRDCLFGTAAALPPTRWLMRRSLIT